MSAPNRFWLLLSRALRLVCPFCGEGRLFRGYFRMENNCSNCQRSFEREPGFFLGSIYFNYGLTSLIVAIVYPALLFNRWVRDDVWLLGGALVFVVGFPMCFFRYARSLWLGFDQFADPRDESPQE